MALYISFRAQRYYFFFEFATSAFHFLKKNAKKVETGQVSTIF